MGMQKVMIIEVEAKPEKPGAVYKSPFDVETRVNEFLSDGWRIAQVHQMGELQGRLTALLVLER